MKKTLLILTLSVLMVAIVFSGCRNNKNISSDEKKDPIKIGVTTAITGPSPLNGQRTKEGIMMAVNEINAAGGINGSPLEVIIEDDSASTSGTINSINKLLSEDVVAIVGPHMSANVVAVQEQLKTNKKVFLYGGSSPSLSDMGNEYGFRVRPSDSLACQIACKYLSENLKCNKIGMIFDNDNWATSAKELIEKTLQENKTDFVCEGYNTGDKDMSGQLTKLKNSGIDSLIVWGHDAEIAIIAKQIKELGIDIPIMGSAGFAMSTVLDLMDSSVSEGIYAISEFTPYSEDENVSNFVKKYREEYKTDPDLYSAAYYDAMYLLKDALERADSTDSESLRKSLSETAGVKGVMSTLTASDKGDMIHEMFVCRIKDGKAYVEGRVFEDGYGQ